MKRKKNSASVGTQKSKVFFFFRGRRVTKSHEDEKKKSTGNKSRQYDYTDIFWVPENSEMKKQQKIYT